MFGEVSLESCHALCRKRSMRFGLLKLDSCSNAPRHLRGHGHLERLSDSPQISLIMSHGAGPEFWPHLSPQPLGLWWLCFWFSSNQRIRGDMDPMDPMETQVRLTKYPGLQRMLSSSHVSGQTSAVLCTCWPPAHVDTKPLKCGSSKLRHAAWF